MNGEVITIVVLAVAEIIVISAFFGFQAGVADEQKRSGRKRQPRNTDAGTGKAEELLNASAKSLWLNEAAITAAERMSEAASGDENANYFTFCQETEYDEANP